ncbi:MAG TPA: hypothetical protein VFO08_15245 [Methylomirabilota bacterium]|nr:hypothetical protein [Methylomirabilota bacterium]
MAGRAGRVGLAITLLGLMLPLPAWAGSAQATLTVAVVVPARCAVRVAGSLAASDGMVAGSREAVAMRCTKGSLPSSTGPSSPSAVRPRITRDLVMTTAPSTSSPQPLSETGLVAGTEAAGPRLVVTVNF